MKSRALLCILLGALAVVVSSTVPACGADDASPGPGEDGGGTGGSDIGGADASGPDSGGADASGTDDGGADVSHVVPHESPWGIYELDLLSGAVRLIYGTTNELSPSALRLDPAGATIAFAMKIDGTTDNDMEICTVGIDGTGFKRLTTNTLMDVYPAWSPDGSQIAYLSMRTTLDIYVMDSMGGNQRPLYDSGDHDGDPHWVGNKIAFTKGFQIWTVDSDGTGPFQVTNPADAGKWGKANLPIGDYDPRFNPGGTRIVFERMVDTTPVNGSYDLFTVGADGKDERRLTTTGYAQGLASWSNAGDKIVYTVSAISGQGLFRLFMMNADGTGDHNFTPAYFPQTFLCHSPSFGADDTKMLFIGQWWQ